MHGAAVPTHHDHEGGLSEADSSRSSRRHQGQHGESSREGASIAASSRKSRLSSHGYSLSNNTGVVLQEGINSRLPAVYPSEIELSRRGHRQEQHRVVHQEVHPEQQPQQEEALNDSSGSDQSGGSNIAIRSSYSTSMSTVSSLTQDRYITYRYDQEYRMEDEPYYRYEEDQYNVDFRRPNLVDHQYGGSEGGQGGGRVFKFRAEDLGFDTRFVRGDMPAPRSSRSFDGEHRSLAAFRKRRGGAPRYYEEETDAYGAFDEGVQAEADDTGRRRAYAENHDYYYDREAPRYHQDYYTAPQASDQYHQDYYDAPQAADHYRRPRNATRSSSGRHWLEDEPISRHSHRSQPHPSAHTSRSVHSRQIDSLYHTTHTTRSEPWDELERNLSLHRAPREPRMEANLSMYETVHSSRSEHAGTVRSQRHSSRSARSEPWDDLERSISLHRDLRIETDLHHGTVHSSRSAHAGTVDNQRHSTRSARSEPWDALERNRSFHRPSRIESDLPSLHSVSQQLPNQEHSRPGAHHMIGPPPEYNQFAEYDNESYPPKWEKLPASDWVAADGKAFSRSGFSLCSRSSSSTKGSGSHLSSKLPFAKLPPVRHTQEQQPPKADEDTFPAFPKGQYAVCASQPSSSSVAQEDKPVMVEITPGIKERLRRVEETRKAVARDFFTPVSCRSCSQYLFCIADLSYFACPKCETISALEKDDRFEGCSIQRHGLGVGFTVDTLFRMRREFSSDDPSSDGHSK